MKIFLIEDEPAIRTELARLLQKYGYDCEAGDDFARIADQALASGAGLVLLDINLPVQDGFQVCRQIRRQSDVPILVLTSRSTDFDELMSLNLGADDFVAKPYNPQVLLARIQRLLARAGAAPAAPAVLEHGGLVLDLARAEMRCGGKTQQLTKNEFGILRLLMQNKGQILPREVLIDELWQSEAFIDENTLNVNIARLRRKLAEIGLPDYLKTRRGMGYQV